MNQLRKDGPSRSRNVIDAQHVHIAQATPPSAVVDGVTTFVADDGKGPRITLLREGDKVQTIEIHCTCGEIIRLDCEY